MPTKLAASLRLKATASDEDISSAVDDIMAACDALKGLVTTPADDSTAPADATANARRVKRAAALLADLVSATGAKTPNEAIALVATLKEKAGKADQLAAQLDAAAASQTETKIASLIKQAEKDGKFTPANKARFLSVCGGDENGKGCDAERLETLISGLSPSFTTTPTKTGPVDASVASLSDAELKWCADTATDPTKFAASKERVLTASLSGGKK